MNIKKMGVIREGRVGDGKVEGGSEKLKDLALHTVFSMPPPLLLHRLGGEGLIYILT